MSYKKLFFLLTILTLLISCQKKESKLTSNSTFTESETKEIVELLKRFDDEICKIENKESADFSICYQSFFERIFEETETGNFNIGINETVQKEMTEMLSPDLRKEFWTESRNIALRRIPHSDSNEKYPDTFQIIVINQGKYFDFLENEISPIDFKTKYYFDRFSSVMDISPACSADVIKNYKDYNIQDDRIRLLIAIHYLTINDHNLKRKASYKKLYKDIENEFKKGEKINF